MRIIAGSARGARLTAPKGRDVRPTLDRVREALFSILMPRLENARFLDLFAGTGANGIEALSRGADFAAFIDNDLSSLELVKKNLEITRLVGRAQVIRAELPSGLASAMRGGRRCGIVFADPPYSLARGNPEAYSKLLLAISASGVLEDDAVVVIEHDSRVETPESAGGLAKRRCARYGEVSLSFYECCCVTG
jgi:16S rRNA (guanine(966)-N(2))-methyltransferase RsmD